MFQRPKEAEEDEVNEEDDQEDNDEDVLDSRCKVLKGETSCLPLAEVSPLPLQIFREDFS